MKCTFSLLLFSLFFLSCNNKTMNKVTQIDKIQIDAVSSSGTIIKFDYMAHFKVIEFQNEIFLALHFSENWAYLSKNRHSLYKTMRAYMLTQE